MGVHGWIREMENELNIPNIPFVIGQICVIYYFQETDYFTNSGDHIEINATNPKIAASTSGTFCANTVYGNTEIDIKNSCQGTIWKWKLKIHADSISQGIGNGIQIGFNSSQKSILNSYHHPWKLSDPRVVSYGLRSSGIPSTSGKQTLGTTINFGNETIMEITIKCKKDNNHHGNSAEILFHLMEIDNNPITKHNTVVIPDIEPIKYHLAVVLCKKGQKVEIIQQK